jgi:excisionase family DNA binding protein
MTQVHQGDVAAAKGSASPFERLAFDVRSAAAACSLSRATILRRIYDHTLPSVLVGGKRLIFREHLLAFLRGEGRIEK